MSSIWSRLINLGGNIIGTLGVGNGGTGVTSSTGTGSTVLSTSPTLVTPNLGVASATSVNNVAVTPAGVLATLTIADSQTLTVSNSVTLGGTGGSTIAFGNGGTASFINVASTWTAIQNMAATNSGVTVQTARTGAVGDTQNVYSGTWTPTIAVSTGFTTPGSVVAGTGYYTRVGTTIVAGFQLSSGSANLNGAAVSLTASFPIARSSGSGFVAGSGASASGIATVLPLRVTESSATVCSVQSGSPASSGGTSTWAIIFIYTLA